MKEITNPAPREAANSTTFTNLAFTLNYIAGHDHPDLTLREVKVAAYSGRLLRLLEDTYTHMADFHNFTYNPFSRDEIEAALCDAAKMLRWGEGRKIGISKSGLCLALAIVLEALQISLPPPPWVQRLLKNTPATLTQSRYCGATSPSVN